MEGWSTCRKEWSDHGSSDGI